MFEEFMSSRAGTAVLGVLVGAAATVVLAYAALLTAVALTVEEDGSGAVGDTSGVHVSYCLPSSPCQLG